MRCVTPVRVNEETTVPADILLINGTCIVNEAMLSGESTPLLKESIQLLDPAEKLDVDGAHKNAVLFSGTKILQASKSCMHILSYSSSICRLPCVVHS
jgi:cation-transporting ATPase 13A1